MPKPNVLRTDLEGESLYEEAEKHVDGDVDVVQNEITEETISVTTLDMPHFGVSPIDAACSLFSRPPLLGPLWPDGDTTVILGPIDEYKTAWFADRHTPEDVTVTTREHEFEYIDDFSSRGGMVYREGDYQFDQQGSFITRPWAQENPEQYVEFLAQSDPPAPCKFLSEETLQEMGFTQHNGEFDHGMYRSSNLDNPDKIREELEMEDDEDVVFLVTRSTPFETRWNTYIR